eukprot:3200074-Prymnesium_polylepis.1
MLFTHAQAHICTTKTLSHARGCVHACAKSFIWRVLGHREARSRAPLARRELHVEALTLGVNLAHDTRLHGRKHGSACAQRCSAAEPQQVL